MEERCPIVFSGKANTNEKGDEDDVNKIFLVSIVLKGMGAILEILLQILITGELGVSGYGMYSAWINAADLIFWVGFSGLVKCNTFYLAEKNTCIRIFKCKYYTRYAIPILVIIGFFACAFKGNVSLCIVPLIAGMELLVMDNSSSLIARGNAVTSLIGEYVLGRLLLVLGVLILRQGTDWNVYALFVLYIVQYMIVLLFFGYRTRKKHNVYADISQTVSRKKWAAYQQSDLMHAMIEQMPVVLQYLFSGAFEAGVVSIVLLVKKLINFISGPTAKVFLPEFSRLYHAGENEKIRDCYASIMKIEMLAVGPLAVVLLGYPTVVLKILADELVGYKSLFMICAVIFLLTATMGPCGGILQMTGNEKMDNRCREGALVGMLIIMFLTHKDSYFVLYGLCGEVALEAMAKYVYICYWMKKAPVSWRKYLSWWLLPCIVICLTYILKLQNSFIAMVGTAGCVFAVSFIQQIGGRKLWNKVMRKLVG